MDIIKLYEDYNIPIASEGDRHYQEGWVNTACPFCTGNPGNHLGYDIDEDYFHCWRCGWLPADKTIAYLLDVSLGEAKGIIHKYKSRVSQQLKPTITVKRKVHRLPTNIIKLTSSHKRYLAERNFDPNYLEKEYSLLSTGPISKLDNIDFKHRIIIPIYWHDLRVSFQTRSTKDEKVKYITCPKPREVKHHKHILYGKLDYMHKHDVGICVEGVTDVWRLGQLAFATFGITYTQQQVTLIAKLFKQVAVMFDTDPQAKHQACKLVSELKFRNVDAWRVNIKEDPASMDQDDANYLIRNIKDTKQWNS